MPACAGQGGGGLGRMGLLAQGRGAEDWGDRGLLAQGGGQGRGAGTCACLRSDRTRSASHAARRKSGTSSR